MSARKFRVFWASATAVPLLGGALIFGATASAMAARRAGASGTVPDGTQIQLKLNNSLSSRHSKPGQHFTARVTQSVRGSNNEVLIPAGSEVDGTVRRAVNGGMTGKSSLHLTFDRLRLPDGQSVALHATLASVRQNTKGVGNTVSSTVQGTASTNEEGDVNKSNTRTTVGDVAAGTGVGAVVGAIAGGGKGAAVGGLLGAAAGGVLAARGHNLNLPAGTPMTITLTQPVTVP